MQNPSTPLVKTRQGTLSGTAEENMHIWRGIPYAAPPIGDLRWRAPQPAARWQGVRRAESFSASSWQDIEYCRVTRFARAAAAGDGLATRRRLYHRRGKLTAL